ncbi:MAG: transketolase, partial [Elusimicrobia bacterium]|nr:transketolase [Candidatus Obscuribacterium magneticum]
RITIDGDVSLTLSEDVEMRFKAYNWHVQKVEDGNDLKAIANALKIAKGEITRPSLIILRTHIGYGSPHKMDSCDSHGAPLGEDEVKLTKKNLGWPPEASFVIPPEVADHFKGLVEKGSQLETEWQGIFDKWAKKDPEGAKLWKRLAAGDLPADWEKKLPVFEKEEKVATRVASGAVINALAPLMPELIGGSADLTLSNNTLIKNSPPFSKKQVGRNIYFGIREHAMGAILNGMALSDMLVPYGGTFLIFADYMSAAMRIAALNGKKVIYIFTHDSIGLGEDGPTHQPIEHLAHLRATPNMITIRPADANETVAAWKVALQYRKGPVALVLTRQAVPVLLKSKYPGLGAVEKGAYVLSAEKSGPPQLILMATGSEVTLALKAQETLQAENIQARVVSMPSWEIFELQPKTYRNSVLPPGVKARLAIEALSTFGWDRYVGTDGDVIGMTTFGASAPSAVAMEKFGFNVDNIISRAKKLLPNFPGDTMAPVS